ncbi:MAG: FkbM family methyltransferase [Rhizobiales bacterium]|nr:FkbM family methyltransferase [Hyphomicrobiales bacterium]
MSAAFLARLPALRRLVWRASRSLYRSARGEVRNTLASNGETYVQACVTGAGKGRELTVFDVGANRGEWTRLLIEQAAACGVKPADLRVVMFEPVPATYEKLCGRVAQMKSPARLEICQLALSDAAGSAEMLVLGETSGANTLHFDDQLAAGAIGRVEVDTTTLDAFCKQRAIDHIHLLKCDAEGHDARVLSGARALLKAGQIDVAQFEYHQRWVNARSYLKDVFDLVDGLPYRVARVCPGYVEVFEQWHFELERYFEANYLIVREPALAWFDARPGSFDISNTYA